MTSPTVAEWEDKVIREAKSFSVFRFAGRGNKQRSDFTTLKEAINFAKDDPRKMVYLITEAGRSVMIGPKYYEQALILRGENEN